MNRCFGISGFRNVGFENGGNPKEEELIINNDIRKNRIGNLLILIGANNAGKSNVLDALKKFENENINDRDQTTFFMEDASRNPYVSIFCKDKNREFYAKKQFGGLIRTKYPNENDLIINYTTPEIFELHFRRLLIAESNAAEGPYLRVLSFNGDETIDEKLTKIYGALDKWDNTTLSNFYNSSLKSNTIIKDYFLNKHKKENIEVVNKEFDKLFGINLTPRVIEYTESKITNDDLNMKPAEIGQNSFFNSLFSIIETNTNDLKKAYSNFQKQHNRGQLIQEQRKLQAKLDKLSDSFNKLFYEENEKYKFQIALESTLISFYIMKGDDISLSLDYQSTGFRWFFDLFFNLLGSISFGTGDIILIDEPATHLHVKGQEEVREMLRDFAIKNHVVVLIATHSEHFINLDYLEDIRIVSNNNGISSICNSFTTANKNDSDALKAVKTSLTCDRHHIIDPDCPTVFVEGITDYDYLVGMKINLDLSDKLYFLPINGVGKDEEEMKETSVELLSICKKPLLLVDGDSKGEAMKKCCAKNKLDIDVVSLKDIDTKFETIESLFDKSDLDKFELIGKKGYPVKNITTAASVKFAMINEKETISEATKSNFRKVIEYLINYKQKKKEASAKPSIKF